MFTNKLILKLTFQNRKVLPVDITKDRIQITLKKFSENNFSSCCKGMFKHKYLDWDWIRLWKFQSKHFRLVLVY